MKKFFSNILKVFKTYTYRDKLVSIFAVAVFLAMIVKMIVFPYGIFGFGDTSIYTEGLVSKNGIQNLNPLFVDYNEADREVSRLVFSGLMKYDPIKKAIVDDMAALSVNEDKTEYTFKLRNGLKWHDGKAVTIDDVYFTYHDLIMSEAFANEILKTNFAGVKIQKINANTIKFTLEKPNVFFISNFITGILPQHILDGVDPSEILQNEFNRNPIGTGPYMVVDPVEILKNRSQITLTRNPNYYEKLSEIEFMRFIVYPSMQDLLNEVNAVNGVVKVSGENLLDFVNNDRFELIPYKLPQYTAVFMNMDSKILKDNKKVRSALQKAVDKKAFIGDSLDKIRIDTPLLQLDDKEALYKPNVEEAQGALKDAGYSYHTDDTEKKGIRYNSAEEALELNMIVRLYEEGSYQSEEIKKLVKYLEDSWEKIGFSVQVEFLSLEDFNARIASRKYDLLLVGQNLGYNLDIYSYWHSTQANPLGQNLSNYKSFQVDSLIEDIRSIFDAQKRDERLKEFDRVVSEDIPAVFLYTPVYYYASDGKLTGLDMDNLVFPTDRFAEIGDWKFSK
ncbi:MAG: ABC transporter substrate-binding protein [Patescibacteria group bacterium]